MCFVWIWEQTAIISLYNINWLVCITETDSPYPAHSTNAPHLSSTRRPYQKDERAMPEKVA